MLKGERRLSKIMMKLSLYEIWYKDLLVLYKEAITTFRWSKKQHFVSFFLADCSFFVLLRSNFCNSGIKEQKVNTEGNVTATNLITCWITSHSSDNSSIFAALKERPKQQGQTKKKLFLPQAYPLFKFFSYIFSCRKLILWGWGVNLQNLLNFKTHKSFSLFNCVEVFLSTWSVNIQQYLSMVSR